MNKTSRRKIYSVKVLVESKHDFVNRRLDEFLLQLSKLPKMHKFDEVQSNQQHVIEYKIDSELNFEWLHQEFQSISKLLLVDIVVVSWARRRVFPALIIMDMDSTLVQAETIDQIAEVAGIGSKVAEITESAMRGELNFTESLHARVSMLKGISVETLDQVHQRLPLTLGAAQLLEAAKQHNSYTALVSGGFTMFAAPLVQQLGIDSLTANTLGVKDNHLTGKVIGDIVDGEAKRETLLKLKKRLNIQRNQIVAIGDGANDLLMLGEAGSGIAFHAKPKVQQQAKIVFNFSNLEAVNWLFGW